MQLVLHWADGDYEYKLAETKTGPELRALLVNLTSVSNVLVAWCLVALFLWLLKFSPLGLSPGQHSTCVPENTYCAGLVASGSVVHCHVGMRFDLQAASSRMHFVRSA